MIDRRFAAVVVGAVVVACGSFGAADDDEGPPPEGSSDAAAETAENDGSEAPLDASGSGDAADADAGSTFCQRNPGAVACEDFDRDGPIGGGFEVIPPSGGLVLTRVGSAAFSEPSSGRLTIDPFDAGAVKGGLKVTAGASTQYRLAARFRVSRPQAAASNAPIVLASMTVTGSPSLVVRIVARFDGTGVEVCQTGDALNCSGAVSSVVVDSFKLVTVTVFPVTGALMVEVGGQAVTGLPNLDQMPNSTGAAVEVGVVTATVGGERTVLIDDVIVTN